LQYNVKFAKREYMNLEKKCSIVKKSLMFSGHGHGIGTPQGSIKHKNCATQNFHLENQMCNPFYEDGWKA